MQAKALWKVYSSGDNTVQAVRDVSLTVKSGDMLAIMGPSGCGKTTLLNVLSGIDEPNSGMVWVDGEPLYGVSDDQRTKMRANKLGFIFQDFNLLPVLSAVENVELPLLLLGQGASEARSNALAALEAVGLGERSEHLPSELSGGQQQRVAIARSFVHSPTIILCDEPTGNLDSTTSDEVMELLTKLNRDSGTTFLIVTHDPKIADICSRRVDLSDGVIVADSSLEEE